VWICTFPAMTGPALTGDVTVIERFEVRPNDVMRGNEVPYRIVENTSRGIVATFAFTEEGSPVIAGTLVFDKRTGDFVISQLHPERLVPGDVDWSNKVVRGRCLRS
jgi:hypothetical protein